MKKFLCTIVCIASILGAQANKYVISEYTNATGNQSPLVIQMDEITATATKEGGQTKPMVNSSLQLCVFANGKLTISSSQTMYSIKLGGCDYTQMANLSCNTGKLQQVKNTDPVWTGETKEVSFTVSDKAVYGKDNTKAGQLKLAYIEVSFGTVTPEPEETDTVFNQGVNLYYGTYNGTPTPNKNYNHQLWLTSSGLSYDGEGILGENGRVMRLDLFSASATDLSGTYIITDPIDSDKPGCINKKFTYYTYFMDGSFVENKLTIGTVTITCTSKNTYDITYDVQEIDGGARHQGTLHDLPIRAITYEMKDYILVPTCQNERPEDDENEDHPQGIYQTYENNSNAHIYNILGQRVTNDYHGVVIRNGQKTIQ